MTDPMPYRRIPCEECPWRTDTPPGQFSAARYKALRATTGTPGAEAPLGSPLFACHLTHEGKEMPCAGWLASVGVESLPVRILVTYKRLPADVLQPGKDWPPLYRSYAEMEAAQSRKRKR